MKFCHRCKLALDTNHEMHFTLEHLDGKKSLSKIQMHNECWREWINGKEKVNEMQNETMKLLNFAKKVIGYKEEEEVQII